MNFKKLSTTREKQEALQRVVQAVREDALWKDACAREELDPADCMGWLMELRALNAMPLNPFERRRDAFAKRTPAELTGLAKAVHAYVRRCGSLKEALLLADLNLTHYKRGLATLKLELEDGEADAAEKDAAGNPVVKVRPVKSKNPGPARPRKSCAEMLAVLERVAQFRREGHTTGEAAKLAGISVPSVFNYKKRLQESGVESPLHAQPRGFNPSHNENMAALLKEAQEFVKQGATISEACKKVGLGYLSFCNWRKKMGGKFAELGLSPLLLANARSERFREQAAAKLRAVAELARRGVPLEKACEEAGVSHASILRWHARHGSEIPGIEPRRRRGKQRPPKPGAKSRATAREKALVLLKSIEHLMLGEKISFPKACQKLGCNIGNAHNWRRRLEPEFEHFGFSPVLKIREKAKPADTAP